MTDVLPVEDGPEHWSKSFLRFLLREWPYLVILVLSLFGVAYTSITRTPMTLYWFILAPFIGIVCVVTRWPATRNRDERLHIVLSQALHWAAVLAAMNLLYIADVGQTMSTDSRALYVLTLLALGTFTAGVHIGAWRVCLVGVILALGVPAIAWLQQSALLIALVVTVVVGIGAPLWWYTTKEAVPAK
ncbi:MAG: hypothetical protein JO228_11085 [Xanthobacteraceae bacterium]|nr:hypothetical protein [Xanthobacteraceae bacterium]